LQEAVISAACYRLKLGDSVHRDREEARDSLKNSNSAFRELSDIRNMLAHGTSSNDDSVRSMNAHSAAKSATDLANRLKSLAKELNREFN
jgi:hypothetical protein